MPEEASTPAPPEENAHMGSGEPPPPPSDEKSAGPPPPPPGPPPPPPGTGSGGGDNRTIMIVLAYLWLLALIPFLVEKKDAEVQWHAKNGLVLLGAEFVFWVLMGILSFIPILNIVGAILGCGGMIAILVLHVIAIVKGVKGQRLVIPGLVDIVEKI